MSNPFYYLAGLLIATAYPLGIEPLAFVKRDVTLWAILGSILVYAGICWAALARPEARQPLTSWLLEGAALVLYAELIFVFHLPLRVWELGVEDDPFARTLLTLLPLLALFGVLGVIRAKTHPRSGGLRFTFRLFLGLSFLPILLILLLEEAVERIDVLYRAAFVYPSVAWMVAIGAMPLLMLFLPRILRFLLSARPLEKGPLRERLEQTCELVGFRAAEFLVVPTGTSRMANAFVVGLSSRWRYVFFTESILDGMTSSELECVLLHEVTHAQKRHIRFYLIAALAFSLLSALAQEGLEAAGAPEDLVLLFLAAWMGLYWGLAFMFVSRRFETEADLVAARLAPPVEGGNPPYAAAPRMASTLERVAALNRVPISTWSWRHFPIDRRMDILLRAERDPSVGARYEGLCDRLRRASVGLFLTAVLCGAVLVTLHHRRAPAARALLQAHDAAERGRLALEALRFEEARTELRGAIESGMDNAVVWVWLADCERALGREAEARAAESKARRLEVTDPRLRLRLTSP
jgi:Zn-dependent protease with chaperone function